MMIDEEEVREKILECLQTATATNGGAAAVYIAIDVLGTVLVAATDELDRVQLVLTGVIRELEDCVRHYAQERLTLERARQV